MPIVQVKLAVADDIYKNVLAGTLQIAGLVKDNKNVIRNHLPVVADIAKRGALKNIKIVAVVATIVTTVGAGAVYIFHRIKEKKKLNNQESVLEFQKALQEYLEATKIGELTTSVIDNLIEALKEAANSNSGETVMLSIPANHLNELVNNIFDYTKCLAEANSFNLIELRKPKLDYKNSIINLQTYLEIQKQIIESVA